MNNIKVRTKISYCNGDCTDRTGTMRRQFQHKSVRLGNNALDIIENDMRSSYDEQIKAQVDNVISLCQSIYNRYEKR